MAESSKRAIVVGSGGQDGYYLSRLLSESGYALTSIARESMDVTDPCAVSELVASIQPDEIYLLAAHHHSAEAKRESDALLFDLSNRVHVLATVNFLEAVAKTSPGSRLFYASSSHVFAGAGLAALNESVPPAPASVYAITKYCGMLACKYYREQRGVYASCGILFNHESPRRRPHFLSRKITSAVARISRGMQDHLILGDLDAIVDWGYAPDYVLAMHGILGLERPADYVIATGLPHSVRDFVSAAFRHVGLDYRPRVRLSPDVLTRTSEVRIGDAGRLRADTGWLPSVSLEQMVALLVDAELALLDRIDA